MVEPSHYVFAAFVPKFTFSGKRVVDYNVTGFDPARHVKSWRTAWRTLTKKAGLPGFPVPTMGRTAPSPSSRRTARQIQRSWRSRAT